MLSFQMMREGFVLTSCVHGGPVPLADLARATEEPSWLEREAGLQTGTIARMLNALCREYGSCGVMAVDDEQVIGKVRFSPDGLARVAPECVQQDAEALAAFDPDLLPAKATVLPGGLRIWCLQVVDDARYRGKGIATEMMRQVIEWARIGGWERISAKAIPTIPPLLDWTGLFSVDAYQRLGFTRVGSEASPELLEGVRNMRAGAHGEDVRQQWEAFAHVIA